MVGPGLQPRDLREGWCRKGDSLSLRLSQIDRPSHDRIGEAFVSAPTEECRAAQLLHAFTGLDPSLEDRQAGIASRDGAIDILLTSALGYHEVVEVTRSLDPRYERAADAVAHFEQIVAAKYTGHVSWILELDRGWEGTRWRELAPRIAEALADTPVPSSSDEPVAVHPHIRAYALGQTDPSTIWVAGRNAGATDFDMPYLNALSSYLSRDATIRGKIEKLRREAKRFAARRVHLFIAMASTGSHGGLLPSSPSYFTWGRFTPPESITDLWLDGRTGELFHWSVEDGWEFHELDVELGGIRQGV